MHYVSDFSTSMRVIFAGTPEFAIPTFQALLASSHRLCAVYTQPDRPAGRGRKLTESPVKAAALEAGIPVFQPESLKAEQEIKRLESLEPDVMVVAAYGLILPRAVLELPRYGCINVHASLLPRWRGAAPIQRAILAGDEVTGVTIMRVEPKLDAGPMLLQSSCRIGRLETAGELQGRLAVLGAEALMQVMKSLEGGMPTPEVQDETQVTYAEKLEKSESVLDWQQPAVELERRVRAFNPWPVAETVLMGKRLRIWLAQALDQPHRAEPGKILNVKTTFDVATGSGTLRLLQVQWPGGRRMEAEAFLNAYAVASERLGGSD